MDGFKDSTKMRYEGTSARPRTAGGRELSNKDMARANRDTGGMTVGEVRAAGAAIDRGNRAPRELMPKDLADGAGVRPRGTGRVSNRDLESAPASRPQTPLDRKLNTLPSQKGEMAKPKGGFRDVPLIGGALNAVGLKKGGPVKKKC